VTLLIVALAVWGLVASDHLIRKVMCLAMLESMVILEFLRLGMVEDGSAPILGGGPSSPMVDPLPQALMLTAIVIGVCFNALAAALIVRLRASGRSLRASELHDD